MNLKDVIVPVGFALVASFALQYFFFSGKKGVEIESTFVASRERRALMPLNVEVDFFDTKRPMQPKIMDIETEWGHASFSTDAASLESIDFKRELGGTIQTVRTIFPVTDTERENRCFLVALQEKTPFYYALVSAVESDDAYTLGYVSETDECIIKKTFVIEKNRPKIDLIVDIAPKKGFVTPIEPRIFFPAPLMLDMKDNDIIS